MPKGAVAKQQEFLTSDQVIERLLAQPALRQKAMTCILPAVRVGNQWQFRRSDLEAWIDKEIGACGAPRRDVGAIR
jgi:hypothetical protein